MRKSMIAGILGGAAVCGGVVGTFIAYQVFNGFLKRNSDIRKDDEARLKREIHSRYLESRSIQDLRRIGNQICTKLYGRTLSKVPLEPRLDVASRMIRDGITGRSASLAKALLLKPEDLKWLV